MVSVLRSSPGCVQMKKQWKPPVFDEDGYAYGEVTEAGYLHPFGWRCQHPENLRLGKNVDIGCFTYLNAEHGIVIGDDVQIGSHCSIYSTSTIDNKKGRISIGIGSCIGTHSTIMPGVSVGDYVLVAAHSFVNRNVDNDRRVAGVPVVDLKEDGWGVYDYGKNTVICGDCDQEMFHQYDDVQDGKIVEQFECQRCGRTIWIKDRQKSSPFFKLKISTNPLKSGRMTL